MYNFCLSVKWKSHSHFIKTPRQNRNLPYVQGKLNSHSYFKDLIYFRCCSFCGYRQQLSMNVPFSFLTQNNLTKPEFIYLTAEQPQTLSSTQTHTKRRKTNQTEYISSSCAEFVAQHILWNEIICCSWSCKYDIGNMLNGDCRSGGISTPLSLCMCEL